MAIKGPKTLVRAVNDTFQIYGAAAIISVVLLLFLPSWVRWMFFYSVGILFSASVIAPILENFKPRSRVLAEGKAVFITGCDTGFGHWLAQRLDDQGVRVFAGCLVPDGPGAKELKKTASQRLHVVPLDVSSDESVEGAVNYVRGNLADDKLWAVVNNAGMSDGAELLWTQPDQVQRVMEVNGLGVARVTLPLLPLLCKHKGRVVAVASAAGRYSYPGLVPYCMSKSAAIAFCEGLRMEMYRFGVKVVTIEPWMFRTPITDSDRCAGIISRTWDRASSEAKDLLPENYIDRYQKGLINFLTFSISENPQQVVDCLEEAVMAVEPKYSYNPGTLYSRASHWLVSRLPKPIADHSITSKFAVRI